MYLRNPFMLASSSPKGTAWNLQLLMQGEVLVSCFRTAVSISKLPVFIFSVVLEVVTMVGTGHDLF